MTANLKWSDFEHYLKGEHLNGRKVTATIAEIVIEETHAQAGRTEEKPVCYFRESKKGLILSPTNMRTLRAMFGDDVAAAIGKRVQLEAIPLRVAGRDTLPVRINPAPQPATTPSDARPQQPTETTARVAHDAERNRRRRPPDFARQSPRPPARAMPNHSSAKLNSVQP